MAAILQPLRDLVGKDVRVLFVGINPGIRSAAVGHHFAGHSNRFWKLLHDSGIVPEPIGAEDDERLPEWGFGITNLVARATPGIDTLRKEEYVAGERMLRRKVRRWKPKVVAFVGVSLYRAVFNRKARVPVALGLQRSETFEGARVLVLPNPSGRNANFTYAEMRAAFKSLAAAVRGLRTAQNHHDGKVHNGRKESARDLH
jgi:TDG/mug DNA glycosylase family protein